MPKIAVQSRNKAEGCVKGNAQEGLTFTCDVDGGADLSVGVIVPISGTWANAAVSVAYVGDGSSSLNSHSTAGMLLFVLTTRSVVEICCGCKLICGGAFGIYPNGVGAPSFLESAGKGDNASIDCSNIAIEIKV